MAAGDWTTGAGLGDAYITVAARTIQMQLHASVKNKEIMGHPVVVDLMVRDAALGQLMGARGVSVSLAAIGQGALTAVAEGTEATPTDFSTSNSTTVTPARRAAARDASDFGRSVGESQLRGEISPNAYALIVLDAMGFWTNDIVNQIAALFNGFSNLIGSTGTALTWSDWNDGILAAKDRGVKGRGLGLVSLKGAQDLAGDLSTLGGAVQWSPMAQQAIASAEDGAFIGAFGGVDVYLNSELDADAGDTIGGVLWPGSLLLKHQRVQLPGEAEILLNAGFLGIEMRRPGGGLTRFEYSSHNAVAELEDARGSEIRYVT